MTREEILSDIKTRFQNDIIDDFDKSPARVYIEVQPRSIVPISRYIFKELGARFNIASGLDTAENIEILYHFTFEPINLLLSVRVKLDKNSPEIDSLSGEFHAANWIEREMHELLGIQFKGHPNLKRLLLSDAWPEGVFPLRQDYSEWDKKAVRDRGVK
ncbi:MAG: NADH-quinone oxidoreductase subunit C [Spirochaetales bacterium]|nr:NADH-quinone oxidoreductase subunit C [Spirochaetales bacterium]